ncbi:MAG: 4Fe-4S dicluster domain-containing protein [bacterium]
MKAISFEQLDAFLHSLASEYDVYAPVTLHDGTLSLGKLGTGPLALLAGSIPAKITSIFFPHFDRVLTILEDHNISVPGEMTTPVLVVGLTAEDLDCLEFVDKMYLTGFRDDLYHKRREHSVVVGISGRCGKDGEFLRIAGGKCDIELIYDGSRFIAAPYSEQGNTLFQRIVSGEEIASIDSLLRESNAIHSPDKEIIQKASEILIQERVTDEFWAEIAERCIECTGCNNVCPTCTCFEVYDIQHKERVERYRMWDSCQFSGFMREASGHNPMGAQASRTRRRIHHKLVADVHRWGHITCFFCGRCDAVCPTGIGIKAVGEEIVERFG